MDKSETISSLSFFYFRKCIMRNKFFEIFEQDNPLAIKYFEGRKAINEGLIKTYPINNTVRYIKRLFGLRDNQINVINKGDIHKILVMYENTPEKKNQMKKAMNLCGYEIANENTENIYNVVYQMYTQKFSDSLTYELKKKMEFLIHITPSYNKEKILQQGFVSKSKNEIFTYGNEVFFFTQDAPIIHIVDQVYQKDCKIRNNLNKHRYTLFKISLNKVPDNIKFEIDPNLDFAVRTKDNLSPKVIEGKPIDFNVVEKYNKLIKNFF